MYLFMKKGLILTSTLFFLSYSIFSQTEVITVFEAVKVPLETYLMGHIKGDSKQLGKALHTEGKLIYLRDGKYSTVEFPNYLSRMKLRDTKYEAQRIPYIHSVEVTGDVAIGKLGLDYPGRRFTDYMTLLKINGEWKITNKIAYSVGGPEKQ